MFKRAVLLSIIILQFVRLASSLGPVDIADIGAPVNFLNVMTLVNQGLIDQLNPVKTLLNVSKQMADTSAPAQAPRSNQGSRPVETTLIISSAPELVKTNAPLWSAAGNLAGLSTLFILLLLIITRREGVVLCRIQHLFSRAREGICASIFSTPFCFRISPLIV